MSGLILGIIFLGSEQNWWQIDNDALDSISLVWLLVTIIGCFTLYIQLN